MDDGDGRALSVVGVRDVDGMAVPLAWLNRGRYVDCDGETIEVASLGMTEQAHIETAQIHHLLGVTKSGERGRGLSRRSGAWAS